MQKIIGFLLNKVEKNVWRSLFLAAVAILAVLVILSTTWYDSAWSELRDGGLNRGALAPLPADGIGDARVDKIVYLNQNWDETDSLWFYNTTQGSDLMPYDFFRYLPQAPTSANPDGLPLGMVANTFQGNTGRKMKYVGFTCAACHTSQVNYKGTGIRIDGGPGAADMDLFLHRLSDALTATQKDPAKLDRFAKKVIDDGHYDDKKAVMDDLSTYELRIRAYNYFNDSYHRNADGSTTPIQYGYDRLDAFGRIYNRVNEHVMNPEALQLALKGALTPDQFDALTAGLGSVLNAGDRDKVMENLTTLLDAKQLDSVRDRIFNSPNAPVSYPFIWDIPQHDYVQWNGIGANAGAGPLGRNTGEVIGVFATLDWKVKDRWLPSITSLLGLGPKNITFQSSANGHNLAQLEDRLVKLWAPSWPEAAKAGLLPAIDKDKARLGEHLYQTKCAACHSIIDRTDPNRRIVAHMDNVGKAGTDDTMARNSVEYQSFSGILRNQYVAVGGVGNVLLDTKAPTAAVLMEATQLVVSTPSPDKWWFTRGADWLVDLLRSIRTNSIKASVKSGTYTPDTTASPFQSLLAYKARPLDGIWATAPYLHNGSVPTLYDLLLPAETKAGDPAGTEYRPKTFLTGSRELDVDKVGFRSSGYQGFTFDTSLPGNHNTGHDYGTRDLTPGERMALVEYLKTL